MVIATRLKSIDLSRRNVTALDNKRNKIEYTNIFFKASNLIEQEQKRDEK